MLGLLTFLGWFSILLISVLVIYLVALWKVFKKAGRSGWEAIVPFYNTWVLAEISGTAWWYAVIIICSNLGIVGDGALSSVVSLGAVVASFFIYYNLSKKFHQGVGFAVLMTLFPMIMIPVLGFSSKYQYDKDVVVSENGPFGENKQNNFYDGGQNTSFYGTGSNGIQNEGNDYATKKYCQYCGKQVNSGAKYCGNCGSELR